MGILWGEKKLLVGLCQKPEHIWEERISADEERPIGKLGAFSWLMIDMKAHLLPVLSSLGRRTGAHKKAN